MEYRLQLEVLVQVKVDLLTVVPVRATVMNVIEEPCVQAEESLKHLDPGVRDRKETNACCSLELTTDDEVLTDHTRLSVLGDGHG